MSARELSGRSGTFQERTKAFNFLSGPSLSRGGSYFLIRGGKAGSWKPASRARVEYFVNTERGVPLAPSKAVNADQASLSFSDNFAHLRVCWRKRSFSFLNRAESFIFGLR